MKTKDVRQKIMKTSILFALMCMVPLCGHAEVRFLNYTLKDGDSFDSNNSSYIKSGKISYDETNKVITLDNLVVDTETVSNSLILAESIDEITIKLVGENIITRNASGLYIHAGSMSVTIESEDGTGSLKIDSKEENGVEFYTSEMGARLNIRNCTLDVCGNHGMLAYANGEGTESVDLVIDNATLKTKGSVYMGWRESHHGSIVNFRSFTLNKCYLSQPAGAEYGYDDIEHAYGVYTADADGTKWITAEQVVILPGVPENIASAVAPDNEDAPIYNTAGQRVNANAKGILISKHRKFIAR